jgi:hypothetical protein
MAKDTKQPGIFTRIRNYFKARTLVSALKSAEPGKIDLAKQN